MTISKAIWKLSIFITASILLPLNTVFGAVPKPIVVVYPAPPGEPLSNSYTVSVSGKPVPVYMAKVAVADRIKRFRMVDNAQHTSVFETAGFAYFDIQGKVTVTISVPDKITSAKVLPASANVAYTLAGQKLTFTLDKPCNLTIEINGDYIRSLHLFANPIEKNTPKATDPNVIFFGPGIHQITNLTIGDNKTVYIAAGAVVRAVIDPNEHYTVNPRDSLKNYDHPIFDLRGKHITFRGRGIIDASACPVRAKNFLMMHGRNIKIEGVILRDASCWTIPVRQCDSVLIDNVKLLGYRANSDGIDICNSRDVLVQNCFIRSGDDLIVVKGDKGQGDTKRILVKNCVLWNQVAHALSIGAEIREPIDDVLFTDCDVIHDLGREWALRVYQCDGAVVSHIRFDNIRIDDTRNAMALWIGKAVWSRDKEYGHIHDISFKHIKVTGSALDKVDLFGVDDGHAVENVVFDDVWMNGQPLNLQNIKANQFVKNVIVTP